MATPAEGQSSTGDTPGDLRQGSPTPPTGRAGEFATYAPLSMQFLPHLVATNDAFALAGDEWNWDRLPFVWRGSHRARIEFVDLTGGDAATPFLRRQRVIAPDSIVTPRRGLADPRCFVELDRSTECMAPKPGRRSITGKLRAYRKLTEQVVPELECTAHERRFRKDPCPLRLVFVLTSTDRSERRARSIMQAVQEGLPGADVHCVPLRDIGRLRSLLLPPVDGVAAQPPSKGVGATPGR